MRLNLSIVSLIIAGLFIGTMSVVSLAETSARKTLPADAANPLKELIAGEEFLAPEVRAHQDDEFDNPAYTLVETGEKLWSTAEGGAGKSCKSCHSLSADGQSIKLAITTYPKFSSELGQGITLGQRINRCREKNMQAKAWAPRSPEWMAMQAYLRSQLRGLPYRVDISGPNKVMFERGKVLFETKMGRLQYSCAQCHNQNYGRKFGKDTLSQGHPLAYPVFNLSERRMISLHERIGMCNLLARAEPQAEDAQDYVALEVYIAWRSKNLTITAPGVRP